MLSNELKKFVSRENVQAGFGANKDKTNTADDYFIPTYVMYQLLPHLQEELSTFTLFCLEVYSFHWGF